MNDSEARRRIQTVRGRTGAVLVMDAVKGEAARYVLEYMVSNVAGDARAQVEYFWQLTNHRPRCTNMSPKLSLPCARCIWAR